jgi:signal transduction histidine kinase
VFAELYRKTRELETLNGELERRVAERTAELAQANADLERRVEERTLEREAALAQVHEMRKVESLGQLTGGVAHDFNNLLMAVLGNLELLRKLVPADPKAQRLIDGAIQGAERGATLTKRMLAFARRQELKPETVNVPTLVGGMVEMLQRSLGPGVQIVTDFQAVPSTRVDPNQLELALLNLALNARDAMPLGGRLTISARRERIERGEVPGLAPGEYVCICESDTGDGMDEATLKRATEPFFTTKGAGRGTGLGLSMVDGLVAQSGGGMRITSQTGLGTRVELWLPVCDEAPAERVLPAPAAPPIGDVRACRVLVVDDDPIVCAGTAAMLDDLGHLALEVGSGEAALRLLCSDTPIDLVITDHAMPGMTGTELAGHIRRGWPELPVILATGYAEIPGESDLGVPRLLKPYRQQELAAVVAQLMGERAEPVRRRVAAL